MSEERSADSIRASRHEGAGGAAVAESTEPHQTAPHPLRRAFRLIATVIFFYVMLLEVVLAVGFVCVLVGIDPSTWFVDLVYRVVERTMQPFRGLFTAIEFGTGSSDDVQPTIEGSIVFAMIAYGIVALAANDLAEWLGRPRPGRTGDNDDAGAGIG